MLEPRTLLAGVTLITHGFEDNTQGWVSTMADAIAQRAGGNSAAAIYTLQITADSQGKLIVGSFVHEAGTATIATATAGETIIKVDWSTVSDGTYSTVKVGDVVANWLMAPTPGLPPLDELPIHLIGHSRGASLNTEVAKDLGEHDIWVDQFTSLDPHPVDGDSNNPAGIDFGDEPMLTFSNIVFADDYWRTNGDPNSDDPNGLSVDGAFDQSLAASVQANHTGLAHDSVHAWYYGTIDLAATSDESAITIPSSWYGNSNALPARASTGFDYTLIAGGARPASGIGTAFGGAATRVAVTPSGDQLANIGNLALNHTLIAKGQKLTLSFLDQNAAGSSKVIFYLAKDKSPYDSGNRIELTTHTFAKAAQVRADELTVATKRLHTGKYYVLAKIFSADGSVRFAYAPQKLTVD
jgi:hypothetical protein